MRLRELDAYFLIRNDSTHYRVAGVKMEDADGVAFLCPLCYAKNLGPVGTHRVICWFRNRPRVSADAVPGPGRWTPAGTGLDDITFVPGDPALSVSVHLTGSGCGWHGHVRDGDATLT